MELIVNKSNNKVFSFEEGLVSQVWQPEPMTRFSFLNPVDNEWLIEQLASNKPTSGIVYEGTPYIGTTDGMIYTPDKKILRIPNLHVDPALFVENYSFSDDSEREQFIEFKKKGFESLDLSNRGLVQRILDIDKEHQKVHAQERNIDRYLMGYLSIRGFVVNTNSDGTQTLYDGHLLGITETNAGQVINDLPVQALCQINSSNAGMVPSGYPPIKSSRIIIEEGIEKRIDVNCVDYRSLWTLNGQSKIVDGICPRDGSGYAPAKFATDGEVIAISHGNHPWYSLDISKRTKHGDIEKIASRELDPSKTPRKIMIIDGKVVGDYGNAIRNFSEEKDIFIPQHGQITSISDYGLCAVTDGSKTQIYNPFNSKQIDSLDGKFEFLSRTPQ